MHQRATAFLVVLGLLLGVTTAEASQRIEDRKRETRALRDNGRVDIIAVSAARYGRDLRFRITMRARVRAESSAERPLLILNVRGGNRSDPEFLLLGETLFRVKPSGADVPIGKVQVGVSGRAWSYRFDPRDIPRGLDRYGWAALTRTRDAEDVAPEDGYVRAGG